MRSLGLWVGFCRVAQEASQTDEELMADRWGAGQAAQVRVKAVCHGPSSGPEARVRAYMEDTDGGDSHQDSARVTQGALAH